MSAAAVVCTDSSALLAEHDVVRLGIEVVRVAIALDGEWVPEHRGGPRQRSRRLGSTLRNDFVAPNAPGGRVGSSNQWTVLVFAEGAAEALATCGSAWRRSQ